MNALGLINVQSFRGEADGVTYFGRKKSIKKGINDPNAESTNLEVTIHNYNLIETDCE